jgi:ribonuclease HI
MGTLDADIEDMAQPMATP